MSITSKKLIGKIRAIRNGYGYIEYKEKTLFFHYLDLENTDFKDLMPDDSVEFTIEQNVHEQDVAKNVTKSN